MNLGNFMDLLKQGSRMRSEMERVRKELDRVIVEGSAGGGLVRVKVNGKQEVTDCKIDQQIFADKDVELLEDLIVAATNQALGKSHESAAEKMKQVVGNFDSPALQELLQKFADKPQS